jgi:cysteinyl-tRNA synthetase
MDLKFFNTLTRKKDTFRPIKKGEVGMYTCGPTVYSFQHIGNLKAYIFADLVKRTLIINGYKVNHIINITDVGHLTSDSDEGDDKMEKAASKEGKSAKEIADYYFDIFHKDLKKLNFIEPLKWTKATSHIKEQIELITKLEKKGFVYKTSDGVYFDSSKFKEYGKMARLNIEGLKSGKRVSMGEKKNPTDFALWKFSSSNQKRQQEWVSPWGLGFPGWHIECSAMSMKYLGEHFDIHTGGEDHIPVHHTNEIAQSEAATGKKFVNVWLHSAFLNYKGEKISKSKGGLYTLSELEEKGYSPMHYRYFILLTHYRKSFNFSLELLESAKQAYERLARKVVEIKNLSHKGEDKTQDYFKMFKDSINDDINSPKSIQIIIKMLDDFNFDSQKKVSLLKKFDEALGLDLHLSKKEILEIPNEVKKLLDQRELIREEKRWAESDIIRDRIKEYGFLVKDTPEGQKVEKI